MTIRASNEPREFDVRRPMWGWSVEVTESKLDWRRRQVIKGYGWLTPRPRVGDVLILESTAGFALHFRVAKVETYRDPQDMFRFVAVLIEGGKKP